MTKISLIFTCITLISRYQLIKMSVMKEAFWSKKARLASPSLMFLLRRAMLRPRAHRRSQATHPLCVVVPEVHVSCGNEVVVLGVACTRCLCWSSVFCVLCLVFLICVKTERNAPFDHAKEPSGCLISTEEWMYNVLAPLHHALACSVLALAFVHAAAAVCVDHKRY